MWYEYEYCVTVADLEFLNKKGNEFNQYGYSLMCKIV